MISRMQKAIVIIVVSIIILAGFLLILTNQKPETSLAEKMVLSLNDMPGPKWQGGYYPIGKSGNESSIYEMDMSNGTISLIVCVSVFNTSEEAHIAFLPRVQNTMNISLGDEAFYFNNSLFQYVVFREANVYAFIRTEQEHQSSWQYNATITFAILQLEKIDRYLAA